MQRFRIDAIHWFLTYPRCDLDREIVLQNLEILATSRGKTINKYLISREQHADGYPHIHVYIKLDSRLDVRDAHFWDLGANHGNYQACRSPAKTIQYLVKSDTTPLSNFNWAEGIPSRKRKEIGLVLLNGKSLVDLVAEEPQLVFSYKTLRDNLALYALDKKPPYTHGFCRGIWIWGAPGTGKTTLARNWIGMGTPYIKPQNKWWDGYRGEWTVILDDLDTGVLGHYLKIWADKWSCTGEIKGGTVPLQHRVFIVTSNYHPLDLWPLDSDHSLRLAIIRRFIFIRK